MGYGESALIKKLTNLSKNGQYGINHNLGILGPSEQ